jgi:hypothetical protein
MRHALRPEALGHAAVQAAVHAAVQAELPRWDRWIGFDLRDYRLEPHADALRKTLDWLHNRAQDEEARIAAVERLREFSAAAPAVRRGRATALFRVPLLVTDREAAGRELAAAGHPFEYVYDPPLDDYGGPEFVEPSTFPEPARWWGRHAVPVHPLLAAKLPDRVFAKSCFEPAGTSAPATARPATARLILP